MSIDVVEMLLLCLVSIVSEYELMISVMNVVMMVF